MADDPTSAAEPGPHGAVVLSMTYTEDPALLKQALRTAYRGPILLAWALVVLALVVGVLGRAPFIVAAALCYGFLVHQLPVLALRDRIDGDREVTVAFTEDEVWRTTDRGERVAQAWPVFHRAHQARGLWFLRTGRRYEFVPTSALSAEEEVELGRLFQRKGLIIPRGGAGDDGPPRPRTRGLLGPRYPSR